MDILYDYNSKSLLKFFLPAVRFSDCLDRASDCRMAHVLCVKQISLLVSKQKWLMQLNFYCSIAILTDLHLIQGVFERFCNLGAVHKRRHQFYLTF